MAWSALEWESYRPADHAVNGSKIVSGLLLFAIVLVIVVVI